MRKTILSITFALITALAFVFGVMAAEQTAPSAPATSAPTKLEKFTGVIERLDDSRKEIIMKKGSDEKTFSWSDQTKFMEGSKELSPNDLRKGMKATVEYKKEGEKLAAHMVNVSAEKTSKIPSEKSY